MLTRCDKITRHLIAVLMLATVSPVIVPAVHTIAPASPGTNDRDGTVRQSWYLSLDPASDDLRASRLARSGRSVARRSVAVKANLSRDQRISIVISWAKRQIGKPYVFGATGPYAYDCSGLVMMAYRQIGISLPHYTGTMITYGKSVARNRMIPGDIIFPSYEHVGIYIGGGLMIVAPTSGEVVKIQRVYAFYAARRLI